MPHQPTDQLIARGCDHLEAHEVMLLEQMTAPFGACSDCGLDGLYITAWTPFRTVRRIACAQCLNTYWSAP